MFDVHGERMRRIEQVTRYLIQMHRRAHIEGHGCCFLIIRENPSTDAGNTDKLHESAELALVLSAEIDVQRDGSDAPDPMAALKSNDDGWRAEKSKRFVQFSFERHWFCMDLPNSTLFSPEAEQILCERSGFFWLRDLPQFTLYGEDVEGYDPFRKIYLYGDERSAAEDIAYVLFDVWKFPVDWPFYVTASAFGDGPEFAKDEPMG